MARATFDKNIADFCRNALLIKDKYPNTLITLAIIPEKDYLISKFFLNEDRFSTVTATISAISMRLQDHGIPVVFDAPFANIEKHHDLDRFQYWDSHLTGQHYIIIFSRLLRALGIDWADVKPFISMRTQVEYGDLREKFEGEHPAPNESFMPHIDAARLQLRHGQETFQSPLGDTWQVIINEYPLIDRSVCIFGDSHSSILSQKRLTYLFASTYRDCTFYWNPSGVRGNLPEIEPDHVVLEISSRFVL
ncbi:hypothetical protein [Acuticoccus sediminis]|uniref:hypothetical protein n=1 Tax=Acuticoccus sediminis TaxID=2184697 RepID=UPI001CFCF43D|nr:hypothetical protein [Acuticoccus sediminis]